MKKLQLHMTTGIQTDAVSKTKVSDMTIQRARSEFSCRGLPTEGTKYELVNPLV